MSPSAKGFLATAVAAALLLVGACTGVPKGVQPVTGFDADRYLGKWYEIARLDHTFERGLTDVSATYTRRADGKITVLNRGFDERRAEWKEIAGRAAPLGDPTAGSLKVSFFWPINAGYHVIALDPGYRFALVCGPSRDYLWILARERTLPNADLNPLLARARALGFDTDALVWVSQTRPGA